MEKDKRRIDLSEFEGKWTIEEVKNLIEKMKIKLAEAEKLPKCGNVNPPCAPNLKFGVLECCNCEWGE